MNIDDAIKNNEELIPHPVEKEVVRFREMSEICVVGFGTGLLGYLWEWNFGVLHAINVRGFKELNEEKNLDNISQDSYRDGCTLGFVTALIVEGGLLTLSASIGPIGMITYTATKSITNTMGYFINNHILYSRAKKRMSKSLDNNQV